jgi:hypothetical protein
VLLWREKEQRWRLRVGCWCSSQAALCADITAGACRTATSDFYETPDNRERIAITVRRSRRVRDGCTRWAQVVPLFDINWK